MGLGCPAHSGARQRAQVVCALCADTLVPMAQMAPPGGHQEAETPRSPCLGDNVGRSWPVLLVAEWGLGKAGAEIFKGIIIIIIKTHLKLFQLLKDDNHAIEVLIMAIVTTIWHHICGSK